MLDYIIEKTHNGIMWNRNGFYAVKNRQCLLYVKYIVLETFYIIWYFVEISYYIVNLIEILVDLYVGGCLKISCNV